MARDIVGALPAIYDAALSEEMWPAALDAVVGSAGVSGAVVFAFDNAGQNFELSRWSSLYTEKLVLEYLGQFSFYEEQSLQAMRRKPPHTVFFDVDVWPDFTPNRADAVYMREKYGVRRRLGLRLNADLGWTDMFAMQLRQEDIDNLPSSFWETLRLSTPHLAKVVEIGRTFMLLRRRYSAALAALDNIGVGMCVCRGAGQTLLVNEEARRIFAADDGLRLARDETIVARNDDLTRAIRAALRYTAMTAEGEENCEDFSFACRRPSGGAPYLIEVCPLRDSASELAASLSGSLVCIIDPEQTSSVSIHGLATTFGFTRAEKEVCQGLVDGLSTGDLADARGVRPETVKTQIKALYAKTGVANRVELIRRALAVTPPIR